MTFSDPFFIFIFLPLVIFLYYFCPKILRKFFLLFISIVFYLWVGLPLFLFVLALTGINFFYGQSIYQIIHHSSSRKPLAATIFFIVSLIFNVGLLIAAKYSTFLGLSSLHFFTAIPLGISYFTFSILAYLIDIYRGNLVPENNPVNFLLYIIFFPKLISGPITLYQQMEGGFKTRQTSFAAFEIGLQRFMFGLGKKVLLADTFGLIVNQIFAIKPQTLPFSLSWLGIICFTLQIYYDFSGYSDMAIGLAKLFGFTIPENFNFPYIATSIGEFWQRWHISLSTWFKNYLYIPLGGNRKGIRRTILNTLIVFVLCGIWHEAGWQFIVWGLWYGIFLSLERLFKHLKFPHFPKPLGWVYVCVVVILGWVFFRSPSLAFAIHYLKAMLGQTTAKNIPFTLTHIQYLTLEIGLLFIFPISTHIQTFLQKIAQKAENLKVAQAIRGGYILVSVSILIASLIVIGTQNVQAPFIYALF